MFGWLKNLFGDNNKPTLEKPNVTPQVDKPKKSTATTGKKPKGVNLDGMTKPELLEYAKTAGIKANASLKKAELIQKIKNG